VITARSGERLVIEFGAEEEGQTIERILEMLSAAGPNLAAASATSSEDAAHVQPGGRPGAKRPLPSPLSVPGAMDDAARSARIAVEMAARTLEEVRMLSSAVQELGRVAATLLERFTDVTHLTVAEAARFLGVSEKTVRSRIKEGSLALETIPRTRRYGISTRQLSSGWVSAKLARQFGRKELP
jgi:excisionase family DNA binding protein